MSAALLALTMESYKHMKEAIPNQVASKQEATTEANIGDIPQHHEAYNRPKGRWAVRIMLGFLPPAKLQLVFKLHNINIMQSTCMDP